jgi:hypothetical protein
MTKLTKADDFMFFKDSATGLVFAGQGAFLYPDNMKIMVQPTVTVAMTDELHVEKGVYVTFSYCEHDHNFYVGKPEEIPKLLKALWEGRESKIVVEPDYYGYLMGVKHQAHLDSWSRSPDRMGS